MRSSVGRSVASASACTVPAAIDMADNQSHHGRVNRLDGPSKKASVSQPGHYRSRQCERVRLDEDGQMVL